VLSLSPTLRVFLCTRHADMRRSFDGLAGMVNEFLGGDLLTGHLFVFRNRRGDRLKILYFDRDGPAIWYKRLEAGTFVFPQPEPDAERVEIRPADLAMILDGVDLSTIKRGRRYRRPRD